MSSPNSELNSTNLNFEEALIQGIKKAKALAYTREWEFPFEQNWEGYWIESKIARNGMGEVFKAVHIATKKKVAIKIARKNINRETEERFIKETKTLESIHHENIVQFIAGGERDGFLFLVTEYLEGMDLSFLVERLGALHIWAVVQIGQQACKALEHIHQKGLVHRDIKPSNLFLTKSGKVVLLDLGLARPWLELESSQTVSGQLLGTLDYMAPEQILDGRQADPRTDIYGLGCTLFHLLTGKVPFSEPNFTNPIRKAIAQATLKNPNPRDSRPEIPEALAKIIDTLCEKSTSARFQDAHSLFLSLNTLPHSGNLIEIVDMACSKGEIPQIPYSNSIPKQKTAKNLFNIPRMTQYIFSLLLVYLFFNFIDAKGIYTRIFNISPAIPGSASDPVIIDGPPDFLNISSHLSGMEQIAFSCQVGAIGPQMETTISSGELPPEFRLNPVSGILVGPPSKPGVFKFSVTSTNHLGTASKDFLLRISSLEINQPSQRVGGWAHWTAGNCQQFPSLKAFAALKPDGSISCWGKSGSEFDSAPKDKGYTQITSNGFAFAGLKEDGSISTWGRFDCGGIDGPTDKGYTQISSTGYAFAALKNDGSIVAWGSSQDGGRGGPAGTGFNRIYSNLGAFAALKSDGSIAAWGRSDHGGSGPPLDSGYTRIFSNQFAFAALKEDGSIAAWGAPQLGGEGAPTDPGYVQITATRQTFAALRNDGTISCWGDPVKGATRCPTGNDFTKVFSTFGAFTALKTDGSLVSWGDQNFGGTGTPKDKGYVHVYSNPHSMAAMKSDGSITTWGNPNFGGAGGPTDNGYKQVFSTEGAFAAIREDGSITSWGDPEFGGTGAPTGGGHSQIFSNQMAFAALKTDGSIIAWGHADYAANGAPQNNGYVAIQTVLISKPYFLNLQNDWKAQTGRDFQYMVGARGICISHRISQGELPKGLSLNAETGMVVGRPENKGTYRFTVTSENTQGSASHEYKMVVQ